MESSLWLLRREGIGGEESGGVVRADGSPDILPLEGTEASIPMHETPSTEP